ncbi:MAG: 4'-phosphopantetheinyl transferase superfamily protein [Synergistaceae bacterium]|nr:4'-phosphopantetheinyl transferase superfamily protein [Synergistaceae bacterium]
MRTEIFLLNIKSCLENEKPVDEYLKFFSPERVQKILRYRFNSDRNRTIFAELLARKLIAGRTGKSFDEIKIFRDDRGKPFCGEQGIFFSLSHSGDWVACSIGTSPNGVDVENIDRKADIRVAERFFLRNEFEILKSLDEPERTRKFFEFWTLKEACLKCLNLRDWSGVDCERLIREGHGRNFFIDNAVVGFFAEKGSGEIATLTPLYT